jgi:hypothetical protein
MSGNWKNKLEQYEQVPPKGIWESIAQMLDSESSLQNRMLSHEQAPPKGLWENIANRLDEQKENTAPVILIQQKATAKIYLKFAAAASVIGLVLLTVFYFNKPASANTDNIAATDTKASKPAEKTELPAPAMIADPVATKQTTVGTALSTKKSITRSGKKILTKTADAAIDIAYVKADEVAPLAGPPVFDKNKKLTGSDGQSINDISLMNSPNSYITITGPDGESVKVSAKFSKVINYLSDKNPGTEEYIDKVIKEAVLWRGKFKSWKEKMMNNSIAPAPANFMDIIELSKVVKEK